MPPALQVPPAESDPSTHEYWISESNEPQPGRILRRKKSGFYGNAPALADDVVTLPVLGRAGAQLRYSLIQSPDNWDEGFPVYHVQALVLVEGQAEPVCYLTAYLVGALRKVELLDSATDRGDAESSDLGSAMAVLTGRHYAPSSVLAYGWATHSVLYLSMLEVSKACELRGIGADTVRALVAELSASHKLGLLAYRPYPCQFIGTQVFECQYSNVPAAVSTYQRFLTATAKISRYYAQAWGGNRIPGTELFVAPVGNGLSPVFNYPLGQWALLPNS